jgi:aldose 1-epimerase
MIVAGPDGDHAVLDLDDGARMSELVLGGRSLLVPFDGQDAMWWGGFVMAPWASLLRDVVVAGAQSFTPPSDDTAWHGTARVARWAPAGAGVAECDLPGPWPFGGRARIGLAFDQDDLLVELSVIAGESGMPAAIGWHPWFVRSIDGVEVVLHVATDTVAQERDSGVPTGRWVRPSRRWNDGVRTGPVRLEYPGLGTLRISWSTPWAILFTQSPQGVCVEPTTSPAERLDDVLGPGEELSLRVQLSWVAGP